MRNKVKVVLIDDEPFPYQETLHRHGYHITKKDDIDDIQSIEVYDIVLCDIKGVGRKLNATLEGAHVISEIRKRYPFKYIIAYSGETFNPTFNRHFQMADKSIKKDADLEDWLETLDKATEQTLAPYSQWQKMKKALLEREIPLLDVMRLEDKFVNSILKKDRESFITDKALIHLPRETQQLLKDFSKQIILKLLLAAAS
ncbi:TPA: hypothetical protein DEP96_00075 [Candidatus Uhrbacteria bacterium]|nr:hypothetical protein [Candidatus Uhrbacteria bacterium]